MILSQGSLSEDFCFLMFYYRKWKPWLFIINLQPDIDTAATLDVSESGAVEVGHQSLVANLVGNKEELDVYSVVWLQIWKPVGNTKSNKNNNSFEVTLYIYIDWCYQDFGWQCCAVKCLNWG